MRLFGWTAMDDGGCKEEMGHKKRSSFAASWKVS
jgi:hypothetical protein